MNISYSRNMNGIGFDAVANTIRNATSRCDRQKTILLARSLEWSNIQLGLMLLHMIFAGIAALEVVLLPTGFGRIRITVCDSLMEFVAIRTSATISL